MHPLLDLGFPIECLNLSRLLPLTSSNLYNVVGPSTDITQNNFNGCQQNIDPKARRQSFIDKLHERRLLPHWFFHNRSHTRSFSELPYLKHQERTSNQMNERTQYATITINQMDSTFRADNGGTGNWWPYKFFTISLWHYGGH